MGWGLLLLLLFSSKLLDKSQALKKYLSCAVRLLVRAGYECAQVNLLYVSPLLFLQAFLTSFECIK